MFRYLSLVLLSLYCLPKLIAQPVAVDASRIHSRLEQLNVLATVLYVAAHPDDENNRLITYLANDRHARTAYLSLTRGDGGQNLIGPELRELLGVIRTQELLEARKIDGGLQYFSRANDFGYSKNPEETLRIWDKQELLKDIVKVIREFRPDVIINRFDARTPGSTHGHHTTSALLGQEAFTLAADAAFPNSGPALPAWQPQRLFMNTSWWFYGSREKFEKADKSSMVRMATGTYYPDFGKSNQEIAAESRSSHKSQGFGSAGARGTDEEFLEFLKGRPIQPGQDIFAGIDTSWNRLDDGAPIAKLVSKIIASFDYAHPDQSIPSLVTLLSKIETLKDPYWRQVKSQEVRDLIADCSGLFLEATASVSEACPGQQVGLKLEAVNRSSVPMKLVSVSAIPEIQAIGTKDLSPNSDQIIESSFTVPTGFDYTRPYWLIAPASVGMFAVTDATLIGLGETPRKAIVNFTIEVSGKQISYERPIVYKSTDRVKGEVYAPFDIVPAVTTSFGEKTMLLPAGPSKYTVRVTSNSDKASGTVSLKHTPEWKIEPEHFEFNELARGASAVFEFKVTPPDRPSESILESIVSLNGQTLDLEAVKIDYPHIKRQWVFRPAQAKLVRPDLKIGGEKIAYIMGAGDQVPECLRQMGYSVTVLTPEEISPERLRDFQVVMVGIRAYTTVAELAAKQPDLTQFVAQGGRMIVQYNTLDKPVTASMSPFDLHLSNKRITDESSPVAFVNPDDAFVRFPNALTANDFNGWIQERGLYFPDTWDKAFRPILRMNDPEENPLEGSVLVAGYGKGTYIYTGISFFRELPEGVAGAYRLMANLISAPNSKKP